MDGLSDLNADAQPDHQRTQPSPVDQDDSGGHIGGVVPSALTEFSGGDEHAAIGLAGKRVLDIGCGGGLLSEGMADRGAEVTGIDLSEKPLGVARLHLLESGQKVDYRMISAEHMADELNLDGFNIVKVDRADKDTYKTTEVLEHIKNPRMHGRLTRTLPGVQFKESVKPNSDYDITIIVGNDNNLPFSSSRDPNKADDNEFVLLEVGDFLKAK